MVIDANLLLDITRDIVVAEISRTEVRPEALPDLIRSVHDSLCAVAGIESAVKPRVDHLVGAETIEPARERSFPVKLAPIEEAMPEPALPPLARTAREEGREPVVSRDRSVAPEHIVCLFDGVKRKMLKRHIKTRYGLSPDAYRRYWELPADYPMTAPAYSDEKRDYALQTGFGLTRDMRRRAGRSARG